MLQRLLVAVLFRRLHVARDVARFGFRRYRSRTAIIAGRRVLTYAELEDRVLRLADGLTERGVRKGDVLFALLPDGSEQIEVRLAAYEIGAVLAAFHSRHGLDVVLDAARMLRPRLFIHDPEVARAAALAVSEAVPVDLVALGPAGDYEALIRASDPRRATHRVSPDDVATLAFTSGTTGPPKALVTTHRAMLASLKMTVANVRVAPGRAEVFLLGIPLVGAGGGALLPTLLSGSAIVIPAAYDAGEFLRAIETHRVTRAFLTPSLLIDLLDHPDLPQHDLSSLRNVIYGTAPTPSAKLEEALARLGPILQQGYGLAEVLPPVSLLHMDEHLVGGQVAPRHILGSAGRIVPGVTVRIIDEHASDTAPGEIGEILIASPTAFSGYWERPDLTEQARHGAFVRTGDLGRIDEDGRLHVLARRADLIRRRGRVIYPRQVEDVLHDHPAVKEACLVGGEHDSLVMCVSLRRRWRRSGESGGLADELRGFLGERLEPPLVPDRFVVLDELPRSYLGKVLRSEVRALLSTGARETAPRQTTIHRVHGNS